MVPVFNFLLFLIGLLSFWTVSLLGFEFKKRVEIGIIYGILAVGIFYMDFTLEFSSYRYTVKGFTNEFIELERAVKNNSNRNECVIIPPDLDYWGVISRREAFLDINTPNFPIYQKSLTLEVYQRLLRFKIDIMRLKYLKWTKPRFKKLLFYAFSKLGPDDFHDISRSYNCSLLVLYQDDKRRLNLPVLFSNQLFRLYKFPKRSLKGEK